MKPRLFIGSSREHLDLASAAQANLSHSLEVTVWDQGVFQLSETALESLVAELKTSDFALFVFAPDDVVKIRHKTQDGVRDNVVFELGLAVGVLGKDRCYYMIPDKSDALRLPTDLIGMTPAVYETDREDARLRAATGTACADIRDVVKRLGKRSDRLSPTASTASEQKEQTEAEQLEEKLESDAAPVVAETGKIGEAWLTAFVDKDYPLAERLLNTAIEQAPAEKRADLRSWLGLTKYHANPLAGTKYLRELIAEKLKDASPYWALGFALTNSGHYSKAIAVLSEGISEVGFDFTLVSQKVRALTSLDRRGEAEQLLIQAIEKAPDNPNFPVALAAFYMEQGDKDKARATLERADEAFPENPEILLKFASLLDDFTDKRLALVPYTHLTRIDPKNPTYVGQRANVLLTLQLYDHAMNGYKEALKLSEPDKSAWLLGNIGNLLSHRGFHSDAIEFFERALKIEPESSYSHERLAAAIKARDEEEKTFWDTLKEARQELAKTRVDVPEQQPG